MSMAAIQDGEIHHMKLTSAGQVSVPAAVRKRWATTRVRIVDHGDHLVLEPEPDNPFLKFIGILPRVGMTIEESRAEDREVEAEKEERLWGPR